jgi:hypothetical protein
MGGAGARDLECEEADHRRVEEIARQLEESEQDRVSADWADNRKPDDTRIEANVGGPLPSNIREYLDELIKSFALCPPIRPHALRTLYNRKDYPAMLGWIKDSMRLDLQVGLRMVDDRPKKSPPLWIELPERMPTVGTVGFKQTSVTVNVRRDILKTKPFSWVVAGFAHELSHVVLSSVGHRLQHDEKAVELTAMILGYQRYIGDAEVTDTKFSWSLMLLFGVMSWQEETWRLGYLTSNEARAARKYLAKIERAQKSNVGSSVYRQSEDERGIIAAFIGGAALLSIVMLLIFFQGRGTDAARPQGASDSSAQANSNKLNPPPDDIVAAQNRLIELRFLAGPSDGVWGPKSRMALRAFKIANGLTADYKWDDLVSGRLYSTQAARSPLPLARTGR